MDEFVIGVTHADGLAAEAVLKKLAEIEIDKDSIRLYSTGDSVGNRLPYGEHYIVTLDQNEDSFEQCGLVFQLEEDAVLSEKITKEAGVLIKQGGNAYFSSDLEDYESQLDYSQNTFELVDADAYLVLKLLKAVQQISDVNAAQVVILQPASSEGKAGVDELASQTIELLNARPVDHRVFPVQQAFNLFAKKMSQSSIADQIKQNMGDELQDVQVQHVQVPVFYGVTIIVALQCEFVLNEAQLRNCFSELNGMRLATDNDDVISPVSSLQDDSLAVISQLVVSEQNSQNVQFVITADHLRHGIAESFLNAMLVIRKTFL